MRLYRIGRGFRLFDFARFSQYTSSMARSGVSTFDLLGDLPSGQRTLMRLFLRRVQMTASELEAALAELPEEKRLSREESRAALEALLDQGWVRKTEQNGQVTYSVQQQSTSR